MKIETKYNIGDILYCPRSVSVTNKIKKDIDGEEWERYESRLTPYVKMIRISRIRVGIEGDLRQDVRYSCDAKKDIADEWEDEGLLRSYTDEMLDRAYDNYEQAIEKATEYAVHKKREYFG